MSRARFFRTPRTMLARHAVLLPFYTAGTRPLWSYLDTGTLPRLISFVWTGGSGFDFASSLCGCPILAGWVGLGWVGLGKDGEVNISFSCSLCRLHRTGAPHRTFFQPSIVLQSVSTAHSELYRFVFCCLQNRSNKYGTLLNISTIVVLDE
jgi:hypothetical protein